MSSARPGGASHGESTSAMAIEAGRRQEPVGSLGAGGEDTRAGGIVPLRLWLGGGLLVAAIVYLVITGLQTSAVYYVTVSELRTRDGAAASQTVRVAGAVVDGSIQRDATHLRFELTDGTATVPVVHTGTVPDLFGYRAEGAYQDVVVEGRYTPGGVLEARSLIVKHGPAFEAATDDAPAR